MKFITVSDLTRHSTKVWKDLKSERHLVLTYYGKPIAILTAVDEESLEATLAGLRRATTTRVRR